MSGSLAQFCSICGEMERNNNEEVGERFLLHTASICHSRVCVRFIPNIHLLCSYTYILITHIESVHSQFRNRLTADRVK